MIDRFFIGLLIFDIKSNRQYNACCSQCLNMKKLPSAAFPHFHIIFSSLPMIFSL